MTTEPAAYTDAAACGCEDDVACPEHATPHDVIWQHASKALQPHTPDHKAAGYDVADAVYRALTDKGLLPVGPGDEQRPAPATPDGVDLDTLHRFANAPSSFPSWFAREVALELIGKRGPVNTVHGPVGPDGAQSPDGLLGELARDKLDALPKPVAPEPRGLGAVVKDGEGRKYVRYTNDPLAPWTTGGPEHTRPYRYYSDLDVVEVLSEGVATDGH